MVHLSRATQALALLVIAAASIASAQITGDVPDLSTATRTTASSTASSTESSTTESSTEFSTTTPSASATESSSFVTTGTATNSGAIHISNLPTIAGAGIPTMVVPYTANAPFMQHSNLPEGTVFIVVGAVLAFMGACVLFWRGLVAWSINRSVRKSALASIRGSEKASTAWGGSSAGYNPVKGGGGLYQDPGSSMSLDALNAQGKPLKSHFKDHDAGRASPPAGLFFSPTAQARHTSDANPRPLSNYMDNRSSTYLPAGYYASPSAQAAGGAPATTIGGNLAPYARHSTLNPSPPSSPGLPATRSSGAYRATSRDGLKPASRDGLGSSSRNSYLDAAGARPGHSSGIFSQPSSSTLGLGNRASNADLPGSRAPSAYLEDLFENHGSGPRERF